MSETRKVKCHGCGCEISAEESYVHDGLTLCDDCYLDKRHRVVTCNPLVTYSAKRFYESDGIESEKRLNEHQTALYSYIKSKGKVTPQELLTEFKLSPSELENQLAVLRHLELTKGKKEGSNIYIVPF
jgi:late competence protein required for DNA uptake (superfamily II DNA/RNA helicase)